MFHFIWWTFSKYDYQKYFSCLEDSQNTEKDLKCQDFALFEVKHGIVAISFWEENFIQVQYSHLGRVFVVFVKNNIETSGLVKAKKTHYLFLLRAFYTKLDAN